MAVNGSDIAIISDGPSSATDKRTHFNANFSFQTINTTQQTLKTVTSGYTAYVTDILITVANTLTNNSICSVRDDTTVKIPFIANKSVTSADPGFTCIHMQFKEPIPFSTSINVVSGNASGVSASVMVSGYEEADGVR